MHDQVHIVMPFILSLEHMDFCIQIAKEAHDREIKEKMEQEEKELRAQREAEWVYRNIMHGST